MDSLIMARGLDGREVQCGNTSVHAHSPGKAMASAGHLVSYHPRFSGSSPLTKAHFIASLRTVAEC